MVTRCSMATAPRSSNKPLGSAPASDSRRAKWSSAAVPRAQASFVSPVDELEEVGVQPLLCGVGQSVGATFVDLEDGSVDHLRGPFAAYLEGNDLVVVTVDDQSRDVDLGEVGPKVGCRERGDALVSGTVPAGHALEPERIPHPLGDVVVAVVAEEWAVGQVPVELRSVDCLGSPERVERLERL